MRMGGTTPGAGFCDGAVRRVLGWLTRILLAARGVPGRRDLSEYPASSPGARRAACMAWL